jgi:hypothetical protein
MVCSTCAQGYRTRIIDRVGVIIVIIMMAVMMMMWTVIVIVVIVIYLSMLHVDFAIT